MRKMLIAFGLMAVMLFTSNLFAADQTRTRSKDQSKTTYQTGTQDRNRTRDQQMSQSKDPTQTRDRAKVGSSRTTK